MAAGLAGGWDTSTRVCPGARSAELLLTTWIGMILSPEEGLQVFAVGGCGRRLFCCPIDGKEGGPNMGVFGNCWSNMLGREGKGIPGIILPMGRDWNRLLLSCPNGEFILFLVNPPNPFCSGLVECWELLFCSKVPNLESGGETL